MGRRPRFCPPLLSNRCTGTVAPRSSPPPVGGEPCATSKMRLVSQVEAAGSNVSLVEEDEVDSNVPSGGEVQLVSQVEAVGNNVSLPRSPRVVLSPRPRSMQRKSPRITLSPRMGVFRSPLSRMMLSPLMHPRVRSPLSDQGASTGNGSRGEQVEESNVDWNANVEEQVNLNVDHGQHEDDNEAAPPNARRKEVPDDTRKAIVDFLLAKSNNGHLKGHETKEASTKFSVHIRTVQRIWNGAKHCLDQETQIDVSSKKRKRGRKKKEVDISKLRGLPILKRTTLKDVSKELGVSTSKLHRMKREGAILRVSNSLKPFLTDKNKKERLKWCVSMLDPVSIPHDPIFKGLFDVVVIDEKWFNITRKNLKYYSAPDEEQPTRTCKNKNYIPKIMILGAHARPRFDSEDNCTFDGKIGCFAFVTYEPAKRSSKNRKAGAIEMKPMESIRKGVCREFLIEKVLPAIRAKWPQEDANKPIYIQQDNAPSHVAPNDKLFCEAAKKDGFDIRLINQPPNSPDLNILDLGFFSSIQSIQYKSSATTTEELVAAVHKAYDDYAPRKANRIFLTLQGCMMEVMKVGGGNNYDIPHIRKEMLERQGRLPIQLNCDVALVNQAIAQINSTEVGTSTVAGD